MKYSRYGDGTISLEFCKIDFLTRFKKFSLVSNCILGISTMHFWGGCSYWGVGWQGFSLIVSIYTSKLIITPAIQDYYYIRRKHTWVEPYTVV